VLKRFSALLMAALACAGCANPTHRALAYAQRSGLAVSIIQGTRFRHQIFSARAARNAGALDAGMLYVFIEGDGSPWVDDGTKVARDPTPRRPLALELAAATPHTVLYVGRPCYFEPRTDANCTSGLWTYRRYSAEVVASTAAAVARYAAANENPPLILIGYSGGGTLAVLMASQLPATRAVVTIAANLDVDAWARWHGYLPLSSSVNPATQWPLADSIQQLHLVGGRDTNVPESVNRRYFEALSPQQIWRYAEFDHGCCWVEHWTSILAQIDAATLAGERE